MRPVRKLPNLPICTPFPIGETPPSTELEVLMNIYIPKEDLDRMMYDSWRLTWIGQLCIVLNKYIASVEHR